MRIPDKPPQKTLTVHFCVRRNGTHSLKCGWLWAGGGIADPMKKGAKPKKTKFCLIPDSLHVRIIF